MLIVDAHQDLAWNMLSFGRDYTRAAAETRRLEVGTDIPLWVGDALLGWPDFQRGRVAVVFATLFAAPERRRAGPWERLVYQTPLEANRLYWQQVDVYHRLVDNHPDHFRLILRKEDLRAVLEDWEQNKAHSQVSEEEEVPEQGSPVGLVLLMEGAEGVRAPAELDEWWEAGIRILAPAWAGNQYCGGTREPGPLTPLGFQLLEQMAVLGMGLDLSHMDEKAALQALDHYPGPLLASHSNPQALLKGSDSNRHLTDRVLRGLLERDGVVGIVPYNLFLNVDWKKGAPRHMASLADVAAHIDYVCQVAGDAQHVGLGSDFDGGFGLQSTPTGIDTIADLQNLAPILTDMGYSEEDIAAIFGQNWIRILQDILPGL
jgi:membrane dipeptidase